MKKNYCTTREAADLLGVSIPTVQGWVEAGRLNAWKTDGGHRRIPLGSVQQLMADLSAKSIKSPPLSVVVVEDDPLLLRLYRAKFEKFQFPVRLMLAANGFHGLVAIGAMAPDLLLCDLMLPGVNGFQMMRALETLPAYSKLAIVAASMLTPLEIAAHGGLPERVKLISKPVDFMALEAHAHAIWERKTQGIDCRQESN